MFCVDLVSDKHLADATHTVMHNVASEAMPQDPKATKSAEYPTEQEESRHLGGRLPLLGLLHTARRLSCTASLRGLDGRDTGMV